MTTSVNQSIKPITYKINKSGNIEIGGCDLVELAIEYKTPLYVIDEKTLRQVCNDYKNAFSKYKKVNLMYASKALCTSAIIKIIQQEGFGFDVVSAGELYTVYNAGADMSKVLFNGSNKTEDELKLALKYNVGRISVDNFIELLKLNNLAKLENKFVDILLRITPGIECHTHDYIKTGNLNSKFGFDMSQIDEALDLINTNYKNLILKGLHAHIGSQIFETQVYNDEVEILVKEVARIKQKYNIELNEINLGGGLGVKYTENDNPPSVYQIADTIINSLEKNCKKLNIELPDIYLEPGRSIISTAGITLYTVGSQKQIPDDKKYVAVDGGMADNPRPSLYQAEFTVQIANKPEEKFYEEVTIAGRYCESGDIIVKNIYLPKLENGDILCIYNTGSYNYSMASNYNRTQKPTMVLVNSGHSDMIIERETLDDLIRKDIVPDRLKKC